MADRRGEIFGRQSELSAIRAALDGRCRGIVLIGPAGVGKSRLAEAALAAAGDGGDTSLAVRASAVTRNVPLGALAARVPPLGNEPNPVAAAAEALLGFRKPGTRLVLLVDDAHWLDETSAAVVRQMLAEGTFVVLTVRSGYRAGEAVRLVWREPGIERVAVAALGDGDIVALAEAHLGGPLDANAAAELGALAAGNPLAATELVLAGRDAGSLRDEHGTWVLNGDLAASPAVADLVGDRLDRLTSTHRELFERVVFGEPLVLDAFTPAELSALAVLDEEELITVRIAGERQEVWVAHPLFGEVLRRNATPLRRRAVLGSLVERVGALDHDIDALRVALWSLESGAAVPDELLEAAAQRAFLAHRFDLAALLNRAVPAARRTQEQAYQLVVATWWAGRADWFEEAEAAARALAATPGAERLAAQLADFDERRRTIAIVTPERLLAALEATDGPAPAVDVRATAPMAVGLSLAYAGRPVDAIAHAEVVLADQRAAWLSDPSGMFPKHPVTAVLAATFARTLAGDLAGAREVAALAVEYETGGDVAVVDGYAGLARGVVAQRTGELRRAQQWFTRAGARFDRSLHRGGPMPVLAHSLATIVAAQRHQLGVAQRHLPSGDPGTAAIFTGLRAVANGWLAIAARRLSEAQDVLIAALDENLAQRHVSFALDAALALVRIDRAELAAHRIEAFADVQGPLMIAWRETIQAAAAGDADALVDLTDEFERLGALVDAAETAAEAARWLTRHQRGREATALARRARELANRCEGLDTPGVAVPVEPVALTAREREIALLAADRVPAKEIAERLYISVRTVTNHLQRAYEKLGVSSRQQLHDALGMSRLPEPLET